jgi:hypothetical protein
VGWTVDRKLTEALHTVRCPELVKSTACATVRRRKMFHSFQDVGVGIEVRRRVQEKVSVKGNGGMAENALTSALV